MEITNRQLQKMEDTIVVSENVKTVYDRERILGDKQNLERDLFQLAEQSRQIKADYDRRKKRIAELEEMLVLLQEDLETSFEELE